MEQKINQTNQQIQEMFEEKVNFEKHNQSL